MLLQRVLTALALLALLVPAMLVPQSWPFAVLTLLLIGAAAWEWVRLNGGADAVAVFAGALVAGSCALAWRLGWVQRPPAALWWCITGLWVLGGTYALKSGPALWPRLSGLARQMLGLVALVVAWLALAVAHARGLNFLLSVLCLVWTADIAAYFGGRRFGRRKLALAISPGKSWEGVWSGMLGVMLLAGLWRWLDSITGADSPSLFTVLNSQLGLGVAVVAVVFLCALSVMGDLVESLVKRAVGAKDSSRLLPGHGGVLDRVDALLPVLPAVMALSTLG